MGLCELKTLSSEGPYGGELFVWVRYKRGEEPTEGDIDYIAKRIKAQFPNAELVSIERKHVPVTANPTEVWWAFWVWWVFRWIVSSKEEGVAQ
jgi:Predicted outer membrane protein